MNQKAIPEHDPLVMAALEAYLKENNLSASRFAPLIDKSGATVSQYRKGQYAGNVTALEATIIDVLGVTSRVAGVEIFSTPVIDQVASVIDLIRETNDIGLITGDAGIGKTCGVQQYKVDHPSAVVMDACAQCRTGSDFEAALEAECSGKRPNNMKRGLWLANRFKGANRPIIIDHCEEVGESGVRWAWSFWRLTGSPFVLNGNPEILKHVNKSPQRRSRIGLHFVAELNTDEQPRGASKAARSYLAQAIPKHAKALGNLGARVANESGHLRTLEKTVSLASRLLDGGHETDPVEAFTTAHSMLITDYTL